MLNVHGDDLHRVTVRAVPWQVCVREFARRQADTHEEADEKGTRTCCCARAVVRVCCGALVFWYARVVMRACCGARLLWCACVGVRVCWCARTLGAPMRERAQTAAHRENCDRFCVRACGARVGMRTKDGSACDCVGTCAEHTRTITRKEVCFVCVFLYAVHARGNAHGDTRKERGLLCVRARASRSRTQRCALINSHLNAPARVCGVGVSPAREKRVDVCARGRARFARQLRFVDDGVRACMCLCAHVSACVRMFALVRDCARARALPRPATARPETR